jgi:hypothetical protein
MKSKQTKAQKGKNRGKTMKKQKGGYGKGAEPVGTPWEGGNPETWPGGPKSSNFLPLSPYGVAVGGVDPAMPGVPLNQSGGKKSIKPEYKRKHVVKRHKTNKHSKKSKKHTGNKTARKNRTKRVYKMKGGFGVQELLNFGHGFKEQLGGIYSNFMGLQQPVDSSVFNQPINQAPARIIAPGIINIAGSINKADI